MVVLDATTLTLLLNDKADVPIDPKTNKPIERAAERVTYLVDRLQQDKKRILIPTPILAEVLVQAGAAGPAYVQRIQKMSVFEIWPFDVLSAIELALMNHEALDSGDKRLGESAETPWQKIKVDRQAIAIARVKGAKVIYTDDGPLGRFASRKGMLVIKLHTLPVPPADVDTAPLDMFAAIRQEDSDGDKKIISDDIDAQAEDGVDVILKDEDLAEIDKPEDGRIGEDGAEAQSVETPTLDTTQANSKKPAAIVAESLDEVMKGLVGQAAFPRAKNYSPPAKSAAPEKLALPPPNTKKPDSDESGSR